jgi:Chromo (CHRromatin Organisation MOdifier) domain
MVESTTSQRKGQWKYCPYQKGEKVWLEGTNIKMMHPTAKLAPRRYGPFMIIKVISPVVFRLKIPDHWKIFDMFHTSLLVPYHETTEHGPNYEEPTPDLINGQLEYEVEQVLGARCYSRWWKLQYLMQWKGYSEAHNSWEPEGNVHAPELIEDFWKTHPQDAETLRCIKAEQKEADPILIHSIQTTMSSNDSTPSQIDVISDFINSMIATLPPTTLPTINREMTEEPTEVTMANWPELTDSDYRPHTPTPSKIDRMTTPPPMNPQPALPTYKHPKGDFIPYEPTNP